MAKPTSPKLECSASCSDPAVTEPSPVTDAGTQAADAVQNADPHAGHTWFHDLLDAVSDKPSDIFMWVLLFALFGFGLAVLWSWHNDPKNKFNLRDLVSIKGQVNEAKLTRFVAFIVSTWGFVFLMVTEKFTEWYFMGYMAAWVTNALFTKYLNIRDKQTDQDFKVKMTEVENGGTPDPVDSEPDPEDPNCDNKVDK